MDALDPYALLGVTIASTCQEVRKAYYELALHAHPDKGGSAEQMRVVHNAYAYVIHQIAGVNRTVTYEDLEKDFSDFCASQTQRPPSLADIRADAFDLPRFNDLFEAAAAAAAAEGATVETAFAAGGYEASMVPGMGHTAVAAAPEYSAVIPDGAEVPPFQYAVIEYVEPAPAPFGNPHFRDLTQAAAAPLDDYSGDFYSDYKGAFAPALPANIPFEELTLTDEALETLMERRRQLG
jgi:hypothetical protein